MPRILTFLILALLAAASGWYGYVAEPGFRESLATQAFWMLLGVALTTFLVDALLKSDLRKRRQREAEGAFRAFAASALTSIAEAMALQPDEIRRKLEPSFDDNDRFAATAEAVAAEIKGAAAVSAVAYDNLYLHISTGLDRLAHGFVRLYSRDRKEMRDNLRRLEQAALRWKHRPRIAELARHKGPPAHFGDDQRAKWQSELTNEEADVRAAASEAAGHIAAFARIVASGRALGVSDL